MGKKARRIGKSVEMTGKEFEKLVEKVRVKFRKQRLKSKKTSGKLIPGQNPGNLLKFLVRSGA